MGAVAARAAATAKRVARKSAAAMGARELVAAVDAAASLADDLRTRAAPGAAANAYGACGLWDLLARHNAVVWGRARAAAEEAEAAGAGRTPKPETRGGAADAGTTSNARDGFESAFETFYRDAVVEAHGDALDALRRGGGDRDDVGVMPRRGRRAAAPARARRAVRRRRGTRGTRGRRA